MFNKYCGKTVMSSFGILALFVGLFATLTVGQQTQQSINKEKSSLLSVSPINSNMNSNTKTLEMDIDKIVNLLSGKSPVRWVFTGDSITHGGLHLAGWRDYVQLFEERVRWELGPTRRNDVVIKTAVSGWTIYNIASDLESNVLLFSPKVVSINVGMNDCVLSMKGLKTADQFRKKYLEVISRIRQETSAAIILHTPNRMLFASNCSDVIIRKHLPEYVEVIREVARDTGAVLIDHYKHWEPYENSETSRYWLSDEIHPNYLGHRVMADLVFHELGIWDDNSFTCRLPVTRYP